MPIPVLQSLAFTSSTYFVVALARFDINAEVFFLPRLATTSAPSVSEILSSGQNYTCQGGVTCRSVIRGLQALTQYDIYYWFRSEDGAEPLTPVSTMMRRVSTIDVIPYDLTVVNVGADYNMITMLAEDHLTRMHEKVRAIFSDEKDDEAEDVYALCADFVECGHPYYFQETEATRLIPILVRQMIPKASPPVSVRLQNYIRTVNTQCPAIIEDVMKEWRTHPPIVEALRAITETPLAPVPSPEEHP